MSLTGLDATGISSQVFENIKCDVLYLTETLKGDRNILNKHFQNSITNYFMEDYASQFLKEKYQAKTLKEVKHAIDAKLQNFLKGEASTAASQVQQVSSLGSTKYMQLLNFYREEHLSQGTIAQYKDLLLKLAVSQDVNTNYERGSTEWITQSWKRATAAFVYHHLNNNERLHSIFDIWNSLYPEDLIMKKKKTKEEKLKEEQVVDTTIATTHLSKRQQLKEKLPVYNCKRLRRMLAEKEDQFQLDIPSEQQHPETIAPLNKIKQIKKAKKKRKQPVSILGEKSLQEGQNQLQESLTSLKDSIQMFKERLLRQEQNQLEQLGDIGSFDEFKYHPIISVRDGCEEEVEDSHLTVEEDVDKEVEEEEEEEDDGELEVEEDDDFFTRNKSIFQEIGIGDLKKVENIEESKSARIIEVVESKEVNIQEELSEHAANELIRSNLFQISQMLNSNELLGDKRLQMLDFSLLGDEMEKLKKGVLGRQFSINLNGSIIDGNTFFNNNNNNLNHNTMAISNQFFAGLLANSTGLNFQNLFQSNQLFRMKSFLQNEEDLEKQPRITLSFLEGKDNLLQSNKLQGSDSVQLKSMEILEVEKMNQMRLLGMFEEVEERIISKNPL